MTYSQNSRIDGADFTTFRTTVRNVYGVGNGERGYGQAGISIPTVTTHSAPGASPPLGDRIGSTEWTALRNVVEVCASHQGTSVTIPPTSDLQVDDQIRFYAGLNTAIGDINTNRHNVSATSMSTAAVGSSTFAGNWAASISYEFSLTFPTGDDARYFFNSGGRAIMAISRSAPITNDRDAAWAAFVGSAGYMDAVHLDWDRAYPVKNGVEVAAPTGSTGGLTGYYDLPTAYGGSPILEIHPPANAYQYTQNYIALYAKTNGVVGANADNGNVVTFKIQFYDIVATNTGTLNGQPVQDLVHGPYTVAVNTLRATTFLVGIANPTYALLSGLTGS